MKVKFNIDSGYVGCDYEEKIDVADDTTEEELDKMETEYLHERCYGCWEKVED